MSKSYAQSKAYCDLKGGEVSKTLEYFPPKSYCDIGWQHKVLNHGPWAKILINQHPCSIILYVDLDYKGYYFYAVINDWHGRQLRIPSEYALSDVDACAKAELLGQKWKQKLFPEWVVIALENKWRPPAYHTSRYDSTILTFEEKEYFPD